MKNCIMSVFALTVALAFTASSALAQAAAESALLNANSAASTIKLGSALGSALNNANQQLAGQVSQVSHPAALPKRVQPSPAAQSSTTTLAPRPMTGGMITSIKGAAPTTCTPAPSSTSHKAQAPPARTTCGNNSGEQPARQNYKPVVTVSFPN